MVDRNSSKFRTFIKNLIRRGTYRWAPRNQCKVAARVGRGLYKCASCGEIYKNQEVSVDHIEPVVTEKGFTNWDDYIHRMFVPIEGFQLLCDGCHNKKTQTEVGGRKRYRRKNKKAKKNAKKDS